MKINYDSDTNGETYVCDVCGYTYYYYYDYDKRVDSAEEPFIKLEEPLLRTVRRNWEPDRIEKVSQYACPKCGVLQIDTKMF